MLELGTPLPTFSLPDVVSGRIVSSSELATGPGLLVMFLCNHCPFVVHVRDGLVAFARDYRPRGLAMAAICSNDAEAYPDDHPDRLREEALRRGYDFPYLHDATQEVAMQFRAACTPEFYLFDAARRLVYRGQFDDSRPGNGLPVTGRDLRAASDQLLAGVPVAGAQQPSVGCNIKWRPGVAPAYLR